MGREPQTLILVWGLAVLAAIVVLVMAGASTPVVLALIACLPRRLGTEPPDGRHANATDDRDG